MKKICIFHGETSEAAALSNESAVSALLREVATAVEFPNDTVRVSSYYSEPHPFFGLSGMLTCDNGNVAVRTYPGKKTFEVEIFSGCAIFETSVRAAIIKIFGDAELELVFFG